MTYTPILPTTAFSAAPDILNGITTRRQKLILDTGGSGGAASSGIAGSAQTWDFGTGELLTANWPLPDRLDRAVNMTLELLGAPSTSVASKEWSFDIKIVAIDPVAGTLIDGTTATVQIVDATAVATAFESQQLTVSLAAATFLGSDVDALGILITRVAASNDHTGEFRLIDASIQYAIER